MIKNTIFSTGHSNRTFSDFIEILKNYDIKNVVDIRRFPFSRKFPHFNKDYIEKKLKENGINYIWLDEFLGGKRGKKSKTPFGSYIEYMKTKNFEEGIKKLVEIQKTGKTIFFCAEKLFWKCHRKFVAKKLKEEGFEVVDILEKGKEFVVK